MSILVEGKLTGPAGGSINNADIVLTAINTSLVVLGGTPVSAKTDNDGNYSFTLNNGNYAVSVSKDGNNWFSGMVTVTDLTIPKSLNALLLQDAMNAEIPSDYWSYFQAQTGILFSNFEKIDNAVSVTVDAKNTAVGARDIAVAARNDAEAFAGAAKSGPDAYTDRGEAQDAINAGTETRRYFSVRSIDDKYWVDEYENVNGVATPTGRRLESAKFVEDIKLVTEYLSSVIPESLGNKMSGLHHVVMTRDGVGIFIIDKKNYAQFAGMTDKLQERLSVLGNYNIAKRLRGLHFVGDTDGTLTNAWGYVAGDLKLRLAGMKTPVNDLENIFGSLIKINGNKLSLFSKSADEQPLWDRANVLSATPMSDSGVVFTYRESSGVVATGVLTRTAMQAGYKARELDIDDADIFLIAVTGQSLAATQAGESIVKHDPSLDGKALMFSGAGQDRGLVMGEMLAQTELGGLTDLNSPLQSRGSGAVQHILRAIRDNGLTLPPIVTRTHAMGGASYEQLKKGTPTYQSGQTIATEFARQAKDMAKNPVIPALIVTHGEADSAMVTEVGQYYQRLNEWINDHQAGYQAITGQAQKPIAFVDQLGSRIRTKSPTSGDIIYGDFIAQDQWQLSLDRADVVLSTPKYPMNRLYPLDQQHLLQRGYSWLDEYVGQAIYWTFFNPLNTQRRKWNPVQPKKFTITGNKLRCDFETTPLGYPLTFDDYTLGAAPFAGLDFEKGSATVNHVEQVGDFAFEWGLNHAPTSGDFIRFGFNATDPGGFPAPYDKWIFPLTNIRDTSPLMSKYSAQHMWNWSVLARVPVTL